MSGDKNESDLHPEERQDALAQNGVLDAVMTMTRIVPFGSARGVRFGSTSFENHELNQMIDIVESANPELLESAGRALVDARDAIKEAATELRTNLGGDLDWKGEARNAFSDWRDSLVKTAEGVADYADTIGTQVMAAGTGLASVRKSMPPRDTRPFSKPVEDFTEMEKTETNEQYTQALKVEKNRQEAINQMYRLASFYTVSAGMMGSAEEPVFPKMPDVGVPPPPPDFSPFKPGSGYESPRGFLSDARSTPQNYVDVGSGQPGQPDSDGQQPLGAQNPSVTEKQSQRPVGTEIAGVGTLLPQEGAKATGGTPPPTTGSTGSTGPVSPVVPSTVPPALRGAGGRTPGPRDMSAPKVPPSAQGRTGGTANHGQATRPGTGPTSQAPRANQPGPLGGRGTGPLGPAARTAAPGQVGSPGTGPMGRGIVGGTPKPGGSVTGPVGGGSPRGPVSGFRAVPSGPSGAGRTTDGVVGGRPVTGATPGSNASKLPRGTVIGGEGARAPRTAGQRPDQRGVIGAPPAASTGGQVSRRPATGPDGVVGKPNAKTPSTGGSGPTSGRPAAPRGVAGKQRSKEGRSRRDERRGNQGTD
ncbi:hypothetical protein [Streptomyces sp. MH13]|uniref:WXG100 family type VII secretion target n=1 Tax=Streptomyces sp. MH13 TaxID=3417651 RepID=UPI003CFB70CC